MKQKACYTNMHVLFASLLPIKLFHILNQNVETKMLQKRGSQGMSHFGTHAHRSRQVFTSSKKECDLRLELAASKAAWSHWFRRDKAFSTKTDNRTYAQVVGHKSPCISVVSPCPKRVPVKPSVDKIALDLHNRDNSTSCVHVKRPLHNKCHHVTAPILVNRFQVLATHADTSNAVLDDMLVNKASPPRVQGL